MDTVTEFELVLPNGEVRVVTEKHEDLWFALKVGDPTVAPVRSDALISFLYLRVDSTTT